MDRVIAYIDGFNLYYGLRQAKLRRYYWLKLEELAKLLLKCGQTLVSTKYFTARIAGARPGDPPDIAEKRNAKRRRQTAYLDALDTIGGIKRFEGHFLEKPHRCFRCGDETRRPEEKMTDVCIATEMLMDAFLDRFDVALLISGDSDLVPPIKAVRVHFPGKRIVVAFPPERLSRDLENAANLSIRVWSNKLKKAQLPDTVQRADGYLITRPEQWR